MTRLRADALLLLVSIIWGVAFVAQKDGNQSIGPLLFVALWFFISTLTLIPSAIVETKRDAAPLPSPILHRSVPEGRLDEAAVEAGLDPEAFGRLMRQLKSDLGPT